MFQRLVLQALVDVSSSSAPNRSGNEKIFKSNILRVTLHYPFCTSQWLQAEQPDCVLLPYMLWKAVIQGKTVLNPFCLQEAQAQSGSQQCSAAVLQLVTCMLNLPLLRVLLIHGRKTMGSWDHSVNRFKENLQPRKKTIYSYFFHQAVHAMKASLQHTNPIETWTTLIQSTSSAFHIPCNYTL